MWRLCVLVGLLAAVVSDPAASDTRWPARPIRVVVPYTAGGFSDNIIRYLAPRLQEQLGQPLVIENRPGANSIIGVENVAKSAGDGYTFGLVIAAYAANRSLYAKLPYSPSDLRAVSLIAKAPLIAAIRNNAPFGEVQELIGYARTHPSKLTYGSTGQGSAAHLTTELLQELAGIKLVHVTYRGAPQAIADLAGGEIDLLLDIGSNIVNASKSGRMRLIGVATEQRLQALPDVPTFIEQGVTGMTGGSWVGVIAPAVTPQLIVDRLAAELRIVVGTPEVSRHLRELIAEPVGSTPPEFERFVELETEKWGQVIRRANITPQ